MMTQQDTDDTDTFTLCIPSGERIVEIPFPTIEAVEGWLVSLWPDYQQDLYALSGEITQTDQLWLESSDGYLMAIIYHDPESGQLEIN